jgi:palmitoyltransferase
MRGARGLGYTAEAALSYTFVLALSMGVAVGLLFFWHVYLLLTGQTTIEFYGNQTKAYRARLSGLAYRNPYDAGSALANWQRVFGKQHPLVAVLPSRRPPHSPPWLQADDAAMGTIHNEHIV